MTRRRLSAWARVPFLRFVEDFLRGGAVGFLGARAFAAGLREVDFAAGFFVGFLPADVRGAALLFAAGLEPFAEAGFGRLRGLGLGLFWLIGPFRHEDGAGGARSETRL